MWWLDTVQKEVARAEYRGANNDVIIPSINNNFGDIYVDLTNDKVYWVNTDDGSIQRAERNGTDEETIVSGLNLPYGVAVDEVGAKVYWTEYGSTKRVRRANTDGSNIENLITGGMDVPRSIALDVTGGKLYVVDAGIIPGFGRVFRANLNGTGQENLITGKDALLSISLDLTSSRMYYNDGVSIYRANLD